MTLITADIHCGQDYSQYGPSKQDRLKKTRRCISTLNYFTFDHRQQIQEVLILGDLCQREGERAADRNLEQHQLRELGRGFMLHDAPVVYVAGSADPYFLPEHNDLSREYIAHAMHVDPNRIQMPGLVHSVTAGVRNQIATHGHMPEFIFSPDAYGDLLKCPEQLHALLQQETFQNTVRESEEKHQKKGMIYEWGYRNVIRRLPKAVSRWFDQKKKSGDIDSQLRYLSQVPFDENTDYLFGHTHAAMLHGVNDATFRGGVIGNPGSLTAAFRLNMEEPGTFMTAEDDSATNSRVYSQWAITRDGDYERRDTHEVPLGI